MPAPSLPDRLVWDRYTIYKTGTDKLVSWLVDTAIASGYGDPKNKPKAPVAVKKLLKCAEAIVNKRPLQHIPGSMVDLVDEVIRGRQVYADLYSGQRAEGEKPDAGDISHQHFIDALHTIHKALKDARKKYKAEKEGLRANGLFATPPATPATPISPTKAPQLGLPRDRSLQSLFKHIQVDYPVAQPFSTPEKQKQNPATVPVQPSMAVDPTAESRFALVCFLEDMAEIHSFVRDLWEDVVSGKLSVDCATQTTENAFACMRRAEYTLIDRFNALGTKDVTGHFLRLTAMATAMMDKQKVTVVIGNQLYWDPHKTHLLCLDATLIASAAITECRNYAASKKKRGGVYTPGEITHELVHPFAKALFKAIPDLYLLANPTNEYGSLFYGWDGKYDMQVCTAMMTQSYLDIYEIVGEEKIGQLIENALSKTVKQLEHDVAFREDVLSQVRCPPSFGRPETLYQTLVTDQKFLLQMQSPTLSTAKSKLAAEARVAKALPLIGGEHLKFRKWLINQVTAPMANDGWVTLGLAYLYRACRYYGLLTTDWPDMDWLINLQGQTRSYVIEVAEHADEFAWCRHYRIAFGIPPEQIKRINTNKITEGMRKVESQLLWPKLGEVLAQEEDVLGYERGDMAEEVLHQIADRVYAKDKDKKQHRRSGEAKYTSLSLLSAFKQATIHDELELNFSYTSFWATNAQLMHQIWTFLHNRIPDMLREADVGADSEIVHALLKEAALSMSIGEPLVGTQLALAAKMMEKHVESVGGDRFVRAAREVASEGA